MRGQVLAFGLVLGLVGAGVAQEGYNYRSLGQGAVRSSGTSEIKSKGQIVGYVLRDFSNQNMFRVVDRYGNQVGTRQDINLGGYGSLRIAQVGGKEYAKLNITDSWCKSNPQACAVSLNNYLAGTGYQVQVVERTYKNPRTGLPVQKQTFKLVKQLPSSF